jgi:hypothetical protein
MLEEDVIRVLEDNCFSKATKKLAMKFQKGCVYFEKSVVETVM